MRAGSSSYALFLRSIERRSLSQADAAARELGRLDTHDALALVLLMREKGDGRYERAAVRWLGQLMCEHPELGLTRSADAARALRGIDGASPDVARASLAVLLRSVGRDDAAKLLEH